MKEQLIAIVTLILSNGVTWFFSRKKYKEEVQSQEILNLNSTFEFYKTIISDLERRVKDMSEKIDTLERIINKLEVENRELKQTSL